MVRRIGVLALQGDFAEHKKAIQGVGAEAVEVRLPQQLDGLDGLIIPGGESTTLRKLADLRPVTLAVMHDGPPQGAAEGDPRCRLYLAAACAAASDCAACVLSSLASASLAASSAALTASAHHFTRYAMSKGNTTAKMPHVDQPSCWYAKQRQTLCTIGTSRVQKQEGSDSSLLPFLSFFET